MRLYATGRPRDLARAAALAPNDYRIQLRAAHVARAAGGCAAAREPARRAITLEPSAPAARTLRGCLTPRAR
jgi:hypothetical protein